MTDFERTIKPRTNSHPVLPGPLFSKSESGKVQTRSTQRVGWTWNETFIFELNDAGRYFLGRIQYYFNRGVRLDVVHQDLSLLGSAGGTPLVDGASQTGGAIATKGWPLSTAQVLKGGDFVTFAGIDAVYLVRATSSSDGSGDMTLFVTPNIFAGGEPAADAAITVTGSVVFKAKIAQLDLPQHDAASWVVPRITWTEDP